MSRTGWKQVERDAAALVGEKELLRRQKISRFFKGRRPPSAGRPFQIGNKPTGGRKFEPGNTIGFHTRFKLGNSSTIVHGATRGCVSTPTWRIWIKMKDRCINPRAQNYSYYGGRGIRVCDRWCESFVNFLADMGERPPGLTLDRINNDGNYELENCRWATRSQQAKNRRHRSV